MASALGRAAVLGIRAQAANPAPRKPAGGTTPRAPVSAAVLKTTSTPAPPPVDAPLLAVDEASEPDAFAELVALNVKKQSVNRRQDVSGIWRGGAGAGVGRGGGREGKAMGTPPPMRGRLLFLPDPLPPRATPQHTHTQSSTLNFRQNPTFEDCFPGSEKVYQEVDHEGTVLRVSVKKKGRGGGSIAKRRSSQFGLFVGGARGERAGGRTAFKLRPLQEQSCGPRPGVCGLTSRACARQGGACNGGDAPPCPLRPDPEAKSGGRRGRALSWPRSRGHASARSRRRRDGKASQVITWE